MLRGCVLLRVCQWLQVVCGDASQDLGEDIGMAASLPGGMRGGGRWRGRRDVGADVVAMIDELCRGVDVLGGERERQGSMGEGGVCTRWDRSFGGTNGEADSCQCRCGGQDC